MRHIFGCCDERSFAQQGSVFGCSPSNPYSASIGSAPFPLLSYVSTLLSDVPGHLMHVVCQVLQLFDSPLIPHHTRRLRRRRVHLDERQADIHVGRRRRQLV